MASVCASSVRTCRVLLISFVFSVCILRVSCMYKQTNETYTNLHTGSTARATNPCKDNQRCEDSFSESKCKTEGICTLECPTGSRTDFPTLKVLTSSSMCTLGESPSGPPPGVVTSNGNFSTNFTGCTVNNTVSAHTSTGNFGLSFWIQGLCTTKCTIFRIGPVKVELTNKLFINDQSGSNWPGVSRTGWQHAVLTKRNNDALELYVNNNKQSLSSTERDKLQNTLAVLGPTADLTGSDSYTVLDARFYPDGLTDREIGELYSSNFSSTSELSNCRCPVSSPTISSDGFNCSGSSNVKRLQKIFHAPSVMLDGNSSTSWASTTSGDVSVTVDLGNSFQIAEVTVTFKSSGSQPTNTMWEFVSGGLTTTVDTVMYNLTSTSLGSKSTTIINYSQFQKTVANSIKMTFQRSGSDSKSFIIENISISGRCDCDGTADSCVKLSSPNYTCTCQQNSRADHCRLCQNGYFRSQNTFGCLTSCSCFDPGVNKSDKCQSVGGACKCKENVEGVTCNTCKHLTYNLQDSKPKGCNRSLCDEFGSKRCDNRTGACECFQNVEGDNCSRCADKHYGIQSKKGCTPCACHTDGTVSNSDGCDVTSGQCSCKENTMGRHCGECKDEFHSLDRNDRGGCSPCGCNRIGTANMTCNKADGQCDCRGGIIPNNKQCNPVVNMPVPLYGPMRGGTTVTITGNYLDNNLKVLFDGVEQDITNRSDTEILFNTRPKPSSNSDGKIKLTVRWESFPETSKEYDFLYKPDPTVKSEDIPKGIKASQSGGCTVDIPGTNLDSVYQPKLRITVGGVQSDVTVCKHIGSSGVAISCPTPPTTGLNGQNGTIDLILDSDVKSEVATVALTEDATVNKLDKFVDFSPPFEKTITITGQKLGTDCARENYLVYVGAEGYVCQQTSFTSTKIECEPPQDPPENVPTTAERIYQIVVRIGTRNVTVGEIYYKHFWLTTYFVYIMVGCGLFLIAVIVIAICICCCRCRRSRHKKAAMNQNGTKFTNISHDTEPSAGTRDSDIHLITPTISPVITPFDNPSYDPDPIPDPEDVVTSEFFLHRVEESIRSTVKDSLIGERSFTPGSVCIAKGSYARLIDGCFTQKSKIQPNQKVTMKMLIKALPESGVLSTRYTSALRECLRLKPHRDDNVLSIHGIGLDRKRFYIIYPYMEKKTLKDHIVAPSNNFVLRQLLEFIMQVAEGMEYLSGRDFVHKDLATRNCMVDVNDIVKISDAAFSWDFYPDEYMYNEQKDRYLPVRWMAPESLKTGFYDTKSDVWAFAVLMWELLTRGLIPFQELRNEDLQDYVEDGYRLGKPQLVSDDIYELMNLCWQNDNEHRPTFHQIVTQVASSLTNRQSMNEDLYINSEATDSVYINQDEIHRLRDSANAPPRPARH